MIKWNWMKYDNDIMQQPDIVDAYLAERWSALEGNKLLDLGCGLGSNSLYFALNGFDVTSVDFDEYAISHLQKMAEKNEVKINAIKDDFFKVKLDKESFDCVFVRNVVSHQSHDGFRKLIALIHSVLKKGGELYITVPSHGHGKKSKATTEDLSLSVEQIKEYFKDFLFVRNITENVSHDAGCEDCSECEICYFTLLLKKK